MPTALGADAGPTADSPGPSRPLDRLVADHYPDLLAIARRERRRLGSAATFDTRAVLHEAFLRLVHAECLEATGDHEAATAAIARARDRLFVIADKIDEPAYRTSFLENVPENRRTLALARRWLDEEE